jgi:natural product biosynthesis luciferase-like monooxygenase protein
MVTNFVLFATMTPGSASPSPVVDAYPLSPTQHGMLFHGIQHEHSGVDIEQMVATFREAIDVAALERAWGRVMAAHPILRSRFRWEGLAHPVQEVLAELPTPFTFQDLTAEGQGAQARAIDAYLKEDRRRGVDFAEGPLWRVALFQTASGDGRDGDAGPLNGPVFAFVFTYSHAILDGCVSAVLREVYASYDAYRRGEEPVLGERRPYRDHVQFLAEHLPAQADAARAFWRDLLAGFTAPTRLAVELPPRPSGAAGGNGEGAADLEPAPDYGGKVFGVSLETSERLRALAKEHGLNVPIFVEAAWAVVLSAFSGEDDVVFGSTRACRRTSVPGAEDTIGLFINTLPVRARVAPGTPLLDLLKALRAQQQAIRPFEQTPLIDVQAVAEIPRGAPLFDTLIVFNGYHNNTRLRSWGGDWERREFDWIDQTNFPVSLMGYGDAKLHFKLSYDRARFDDRTMDRFAATLTALLSTMASDPGVTLDALPRMPEEERRLELETWNDTRVPVEPACIHHAFEAQAARTPDAVAVAFRDRTLTYRELNARANALAHDLQGLGVGPDVKVGVFVERSLEMMIALMGILKAGGAYVPMDPTYPAERVAMMIEDARAPVIVTLDHLRAKLPRGTFEVLAVSASIALPHDAQNPTSIVLPENLAYVIFTSGSTGRPKGVMLEHRNVSNFFAGMDARLGDDASDAGARRTWLALTSISFDISVLELFWTLARGFTVVIQESIDEVALAPRAASGGTPDGARARPIEFSLFYFASDAGAGAGDRYRLLLEGAKFADRNGFTAVWTPERHFHPFGGLYPSPAVTSAAVAVLTDRIQLRAGSVVLPLHNPIRCAEEWSVVDNLSRGRVGLSFASGWHASDFALAPDSFAKRRELMWQGIETIRALWRGESVQAKSGDGSDVTVKMYPPPIQREPRIWITAGGSPETFTTAGKMGASILTNLLVMKHDDLVANIAAYRKAWRDGGHAGEGHVSLMLHTFVGRDLEEVRERVRGPFTEYLRTSTDLINKARWEQTAFAKAGDRPAAGGATPAKSMDLGDLAPDEMQAMMDHAFARYFETTGLFGTPETCVAMVERLKAMGVNEIACLVDFGVDEDAVLESLTFLNELRIRTNPTGALASASIERDGGGDDYSIASQIRRYGVTHMQCTPSLAGMLAEDPDSLAAMGTLRKLLLGGEALPAALAARLGPIVKGDILNTAARSRWGAPSRTRRCTWSTVTRDRLRWACRGSSSSAAPAWRAATSIAPS